MGMRPPSLASVAVVVLFALSVFGFTLFVWKSFGGPIPLEAQGYRFTVPFGADAVQLAENADVRISGVSVGKVKSVTPRGARLDTVIELEEKFAPVPSDVRAITRQKTLLGETFVELTPGSQAAPKLTEDATLPVDQVAETEGLDEVLSAFDEATREDFREFLNGFADGIDGRGGDLNAALGNFGPASEDLETLVTILDEQRDEVRGLVRDTGTALQAIGARKEAVREMVTAGGQVFSSTARRDRELQATVRELPSFVRELRATLQLVDATTTDAAPVLRDLRPVAPLLRPAIQEAEDLLPQFVPVASELDPVIDAGLKGLPRLTEVLRAAGPLIDVLEPATRELRPVGAALEPFKDLAVNGLALGGAATQARNDEQHYLRAMLPVVNEGFASQDQRLGTNRHNAYVTPGGLSKVAANALEAFDCRNAGNETPLPPPGVGAGAPACRDQGPVEFQGMSRQFPKADRAPSLNSR